VRSEEDRKVKTIGRRRTATGMRRQLQEREAKKKKPRVEKECRKRTRQLLRISSWGSSKGDIIKAHSEENCHLQRLPRMTGMDRGGKENNSFKTAVVVGHGGIYPVLPATQRAEAEDHMKLGVRGQPEQHGETTHLRNKSLDWGV
jgi:hypothetical protein